MFLWSFLFFVCGTFPKWKLGNGDSREVKMTKQETVSSSTFNAKVFIKNSLEIFLDWSLAKYVKEGHSSDSLASNEGTIHIEST